LDDNGDSPLRQGNQECKYYEPDQFSQIIEGTTIALSSFHLNCRSLSSNWDAFHNLLCDLHNKDFSFDIIGVSEVFRADRDTRVVLSGYHNIIMRCRNDESRGGVGLFIKDSINFKVRDDLSVFIPHVYESLFIEMENESHKKIIAGVIYRPNTLPRADVDIFSSTLFDIMEIINSEGKSSLILGDFNICLLKYGINDKTSDYVDGILSRGFLPVIHKPTRVTHTSATLIDHIYPNLTCNNTLSGIILTDVADHFGTFHIVNDSNRCTDKFTFTTKRKFTETNTTKFKQLLCDKDFSETLNTVCPDSAYDKFM
jgi:hypothetical protein